jgi:hypothetical protein
MKDTNHLTGAAQMWPTPTVNGDYNRKGASPNSGDGLATAVKMYPTPTCDDANNVSRKSGAFQSLTRTVMWGTPTANMHKGSGPMGSDSYKHDLERGYLRAQVMEENGGQLNPDWVEWLMGFPPGWSDIGPQSQTSPVSPKESQIA